MQAMFIDVDGTLSSPCYKVNGKFQIGMSDVQWADYCIKHGEDTYEWCRPVIQVKEYAMKAKEKGTKAVCAYHIRHKNRDGCKAQIFRQILCRYV